MNDIVRLAMERAVRDFGGPDDGIFNAAGFSVAIYKLAGLCGTMDGIMVRTILTGRGDVEVLTGGHFRLIQSAAVALPRRTLRYAAIVEAAREVDAWRDKLTAVGGLNPPCYCPPLERLHAALAQMDERTPTK